MWKALKSTLKPYSPKHSSELKRWNPCLHRGETAWKCVPKFINVCNKFIKKRKAGRRRPALGEQEESSEQEALVRRSFDTWGWQWRDEEKKVPGMQMGREAERPWGGSRPASDEGQQGHSDWSRVRIQEVRGAGAGPGPAGPQQLIVKTLAPNPAILNKTMNAGHRVSSEGFLRHMFGTLLHQ